MNNSTYPVMEDNLKKKRKKKTVELAVFNKEILGKKEENLNMIAELEVANKELYHQQEEKADRAAELAIANKELAFQQEEKAARASELAIANKELIFQQEEKADRVAELVIANKELAFQVEEKANRAVELADAIKELANQIILRNKAIETIDQIVHYDSLTSLPNRVMLAERLKQLIKAASRVENKIGIIFLDLDDFKTVNDTLGHLQGDHLLKAVATRITNLVQENFIVARMCGDKFTIIFPNPKSADSIEIFATTIISEFRIPFVLQEKEIYITASVGISIFPTDGETHECLIKNAELAMYKAKEKGKNQSVFCTTIMKDIIEENMKLSNDLYRSLERNELEVYYQPQININTKKIIGLEALLRWNHPELGMVHPGKFICLAEQTGLINPIGKWVLETVCGQNKAWQEEGLEPVRVAVNLSVIQFQDMEITNQIKEILGTTNLEAKYLELEITESIAMRDTGHVIDVLNAFREMGIFISIDDFGTEFSSLQYLKILPINKIKIPMPFIQGIHVDKRDEAITETIIILAKKMGLDIIAEGVETKEQELFLKQRMCDEIQGFYYYKPMPAKDVQILLRRNH